MDNKYTIGEFAQKMGLSNYTLRYYEDEGLLKPQRYKNGRRYYQEADIKWLRFIIHLKDCGMTIPELKEYVYLRAKGEQTVPQRLRLLKNVQRDSLLKLQKLQASMQVLNHKVAWYEGKVNRTIDQDEDFATYLHRINLETLKNEER